MWAIQKKRQDNVILVLGKKIFKESIEIKLKNQKGNYSYNE